MVLKERLDKERGVQYIYSQQIDQSLWIQPNNASSMVARFVSKISRKLLLLYASGVRLIKCHGYGWKKTSSLKRRRVKLYSFNVRSWP